MNRRFQKIYFVVLIVTSVFAGLTLYFVKKGQENNSFFLMDTVGRLFNQIAALESFEQSHEITTPIQKIVVESVSGDVEINQGTNFRIQYSGFLQKEKLDKETPWSERIENGELNINLKKLDGPWLKFDWSSGNERSGDLMAQHVVTNIQVPQDWNGSIVIRTTSGDIRLGSLKSTKVDLKTTSGEIQLEKIKANESVLKSTSGNLDIQKSEIKSLSAGTTSGEMNIEVSSENLDLSSISGEINLAVSPDKTYEFDLQSVSGEVLNDSSLEIKKGDKPAKLGKITVKNVSGNVRISRQIEETQSPTNE